MNTKNHDRGGARNCKYYSACGTAENCSHCKVRVRSMISRIKREKAKLPELEKLYTKLN